MVNTLNHYEKKVLYIKKKLGVLTLCNTLLFFSKKKEVFMSEVEFIDIFGDNLRDLMRECGYTQRELAKESGINHATISRYLNKERMPTAKSLVNLSIALECNLDDLIPTYDYIE